MISSYDVLLLYIIINHHLVMIQMDTEGGIWKLVKGWW